MVINLLLSFIIIALYIITLSLTGILLLRRMNIVVLPNSISEYIIGFVFMEILGFMFYLLSSGLLKLNYWTHFIPILILIAWQFKDLLICKAKGVRLSFNWKSYYPVLILTSLVSSLLVFEASNQFVTAITNIGVLHVDIVYHSGITNSILYFGYPVLDLQFEGGLVRYHIFTHFIASQLSFISRLEPYQIFALFFPFFSILCISLLIFDLVKHQLSSRLLVIKYLIVGTIAFMGAYLLPGIWGNAQIHGIFVSPSYQFQLIFFIIISFYILLRGNNEYSSKDYLILLVLFCFSIFIKGSSLPLLLLGFGFVSILRIWRLRKISFSDIIFLSVCTLAGVLIYMFFFSFEHSNNDNYTSFWGINWTFINDSFLNFLLNNKLHINVQKIKWVTFCVSIVSFRYYMIKYIKAPVVAFSIGMVSLGILFLVFYTNNPINFLQAPIFIMNIYFALFIVGNIKRISKVNLLIISGFLFLSIYPVSSNGFQMKRWMKGEISRYFPISPERLELYEFISQNTDKNDVIFTPSVFGATNYSPDNFYPASMSKRVFYLGGYEYGNVKYYNEFQERLRIVTDFSFEPDQFKVLRKEDIRFVLVEFRGNKDNLSGKINEVIKINKCSTYNVLLSNSAGILLELF